MSREKKKVRSVSGQKFVPVKAEKRDSAAKADYKAYKQKNLAKKKRQKSLQDKLVDEQLKSLGSVAGKKSRPSRLKKPIEEVEQRSQELLAPHNNGDHEEELKDA